MRVFLGVVPISGVLWEYRKGLRYLGVDARVIIISEHRYGYSYDELISSSGSSHRRFISIISLPRLIKKIPRFLRDFEIFHFFFGRSLIPLAMDVPFLKLKGKKIVMNFLGSDIRCSTPVLEGVNARSNCDYCKYPCHIFRKKRKVKSWANSADAIISGVDNSQLLDHYSIPYYVLPLPCDIEHWNPFDSAFYATKEDEVLIVHAPSNMQAKGTYVISKTIKKLSEKHNINFKLLYKMPNNEVREWLNVADIVVDQFGCGWYGKLSVESMALAKPTLCYIDEELWKRHPQFSALPIVKMTPDNLHDELERLITDPTLRYKIGKDSRKYVEEIQDSRIVCKQLLDIYKKIM